MSQVTVRFAPSPTGYLHIGGARTALYNWLFARKHHGNFILRIEDTDLERSTEESIRGIIDGLRWLGLDWDGEPRFQSKNIQYHVEAAQKLIESGFAYKCFCTKKELDEKRLQAQKTKIDYKYAGTCRDLAPREAEKRLQQGKPFVVRFKIPQKDGAVAFDDRVYGHIEKNYQDIEDFVILRSDGKPLYVLSNAVDDAKDHITHVIRGQDGLANTPKQILIYQALGYELPVFVHMPLTLDSKKAKISKRKHGEVVTVSFYKEQGFVPWALCNFLMLLGWSTSDDREFFSREELIEVFSLERISRHNSIFNYRPNDPKNWTDPKAIAMNARYLSMMSLEELIPFVKSELVKEDLWDDAYEGAKKKCFEDTLALIRTRYHTLKDFAALGRPYFSDDFAYEQAAVQKNLKRDARLSILLPGLADKLERLDGFTLENIENIIRAFATSENVKAGLLINAVRTAVTGQAAGPGLFEILVAVGQQRTVKRLRKALELLQL
jgi:glutamyl-tRNA synthetase